MKNNSGIIRNLESNSINRVNRRVDSVSRLIDSLSSVSVNQRGTTSRTTISNEPVGTGSSTVNNKLNKTTSMFDSNKDGALSLDEVFNYFITMKARGLQPSTLIFQASPQAKDISEAIAVFNKHNNQTLTDTELVDALLKLRGGEFNQELDPSMAKFVLGKFNNNVAGLDSAVALIDSKPDKVISDLELLKVLVSSRQGTININDPNINTVLKTNANFDRLLAALSRLGNGSGTVSDQEAFETILALRQANISDATLDRALFLGFNANAEKINHTVRLFDSHADGQITDSEFVSVIMQMRRAELSTEENQIVLNILNNIPKYKNIKDIIVALDTSANGQISDDELIDFTLGNLRGHITVDEALLDLISASNDKTSIIKSLINKTDADHNGNISNQEYLTALTDLENHNLSSSAQEVLKKILSRNPNHQAIEAALSFVDKDQDSVVSDKEVGMAILAKYKGETAAIDAGIFNMILASNPNKASIEALINQIGGADGEFTNAEVTQVLLAQFKNPNMFGANTSLVETILSTQNSSYTHIKGLIAAVDSDHDGIISNLEAMKSIVNDAKGLVAAADKPLVDSIISSNTNLAAIKTAYTNFAINPNSSTLAQDLFAKWIEIQQGLRTGTYFSEAVEALGKTSELNALKTQFTALDTDGNGRINDTEFGSLLVDIAKGVKSLSSYQTMITYLIKDPALAAVKTTIDSFGNHSDDNTLRGLLKLWNPTNKALLTKPYVQAILSLNTHSTAIQKILTLVDPLKTGVITNGSTVGYITNLQISRYSSPQIDVAKYDFNGNGSIDQGDFETYNAFYQYITNSNGGLPFTVK